MKSATDTLNENGSIASTDAVSFFFRGKTSITPEIQVFVRDQPVYVPVGTTLRQLMQRSDDIPLAGRGGDDLSAWLEMGKPLRLIHDGLNSKPTYRFINLTDSAAINQMDVLDLPLIKGDRFYF